MKRGTKPHHVRPHKTNPEHRAIISNLIKDYLEKGIIRPCKSATWTAPVVLRKKKDGSYRLCVNYKELNKSIIRNNYPLPKIRDMLYNLRNKRVFSKIDLAFATEDGVFEWNFSPMGFSNSGQDFQAEMEDILSNCKQFTQIFQDDICIMSNNEEEHYSHVREVLIRLKEAQIIPNLDKCEWFKNSIKFCGFIISKNRILPDKERVKAITEIKPPNTVHQMQKFLGMVNYFNSFIHNYSIITAPLYDTIKNSKQNRKISWSESLLKAFNSIKNQLAHITGLNMPDYNNTFHIFTDASDTGMGCCLGQFHNSIFYPIAFAGTKYSCSQKNYSTQITKHGHKMQEINQLSSIDGLIKFMNTM
uniref:Reverse transcriptase domain-containing protein n=1 Tax=Arcella intermedia TaxID=1963864 RepID=A0A6B2L7V5_9EUKA